MSIMRDILARWERCWPEYARFYVPAVVVGLREVLDKDDQAHAAELAAKDKRIMELEAALAGAKATILGAMEGLEDDIQYEGVYYPADVDSAVAKVRSAFGIRLVRRQVLLTWAGHKVEREYAALDEEGERDARVAEQEAELDARTIAAADQALSYMHGRQTPRSYFAGQEVK